jgi:hypothetical protein
MANKVFANGMEVACKAANGKSICAMPDVCFTPPQTPATPPGVPIPYPNTAMASDTTDGSTTVQISGQEVVLKNQSCFKRSSGDEAGCAPKKGVINSQNMGKVYFAQWSMDVQVEGQNVARHLDLTTHNHGSSANEAAPWPYLDTMSLPASHPCKKSVDEEQAACDPKKTPPGCQARPDGRGLDCTPACAKARACALPKKKDDKKTCCAPNSTGDHLIEVGCFTQSGGRKGVDIGSFEDLAAADITVNAPNRPQRSASGHSVTLEAPKSRARRLSEFESYNEYQAPTACVEPPGPGTNHNRMQDWRDFRKKQYWSRARAQPDTVHTWVTGEQSFWTYDEAAKAAVESHQKEFPDSKCNPECTRKQLDAYHHGILPGNSVAKKNSTPVRTRMPMG